MGSWRVRSDLVTKQQQSESCHKQVIYFIWVKSNTFFSQMKTIHSTLLNLAFFLQFKTWVKYLIPKNIQLCNLAGINSFISSFPRYMEEEFYPYPNNIPFHHKGCISSMTDQAQVLFAKTSKQNSFPEWTASYKNIQSTVCSRHVAPVTHLFKCLMKGTEKK